MYNKIGDLLARQLIRYKILNFSTASEASGIRVVEHCLIRVISHQELRNNWNREPQNSRFLSTTVNYLRRRFLSILKLQPDSLSRRKRRQRKIRRTHSSSVLSVLCCVFLVFSNAYCELAFYELAVLTVLSDSIKNRPTPAKRARQPSGGGPRPPRPSWLAWPKPPGLARALCGGVRGGGLSAIFLIR